ncbi:MAG: sigma-54 dependent transcriptional regulator [Desulfobulbaceae bacterium]|nr:sigma-54 dependent transcriptional regulator [Desulfobulbaceae bacterium]HIJ78628.1 sigma-54-dependent Fis family transcriptional regulator [Deltaproteobacteria bacterium]
MTIRVAVIDDEETAAKLVGRTLEQEGFAVEIFLAGRPFLARMQQEPFQIVFIDLQLPDMDGLEILNLVKQYNEDSEAIIITGHASVESALDATQKGAFHYITKPCKRHDIRLVAKRAREKIELRLENRRLKMAMGNDGPMVGLVGSSPAMQEIFAMITKVAQVNCNVLLQAETGTGKQMVARAIHALSPRKDNPFVYFNCGGFTEELICSELFGYEKGAFTGATQTKIGLFESAAGGTVLLDEIGEMPMSMQVKLLHVLQERQILRVGGTKPIDLDIRIIAATNVDLKQAIERGSFREDLFYRLNVVGLHLPRLSERREDIPTLASHFIDKFNLAFNKNISGLSPQAAELLNNYDFPGNVRELENIIQRAVALADGDELRLRDLPARLRKTSLGNFGDENLLSLDEVEKQHIAKVLEKTDYNKNLASTILNLPRTTLWRRMKKYKLDSHEG